jgi:D-glycero-alpha-D-manno-heptose-7-phosphate kinase
MIITRTPYRVSFFGGGTDFPAYYAENGGAVLSCTINRYSYLQCRALPPFFDHNYRIRSFQTEQVGRIEEIQHPSVRECLKFLGYPHPLELLHSGDIPAMSGIGSSSSFTVGFLLALYGMMGKMVTKRELAEYAVTVEQDWIRENVGSQDQYAAAFGGLNRIDFGPGLQVRVTPLIMDTTRLERLQKNLLFCFSGIARSSSEVQAGHIRNIPRLSHELRYMKVLTDEAQKLLCGGNDLDEFGRLLDAAWKIKRGYSSAVSTSAIDDIYAAALKAGALGGKLCGAGGGGFLVFYVPEKARDAVEEALKGVLIVPIRFERLGAHVIFYSHEDLAAAATGQED